MKLRNVVFFVALLVAMLGVLSLSVSADTLSGLNGTGWFNSSFYPTNLPFMNSTANAALQVVSIIVVNDTKLNVTGTGAVAPDYIMLKVNSTRDSTGIVIRLNETTNESALFAIIVNSSNPAVVSNLTFVNASTCTSTTPISGGTNYTLCVNNGDVISTNYSNSFPGTGNSAAQTNFSVVRIEQHAAITFDSYIYNTGSTPTVTVYDNGSNLNPSVAETIRVNLNASRSASTDVDGVIKLNLTETGVNTGVFQLSATVGDGSNDRYAVVLTNRSASADNLNQLRVNSVANLTLYFNDTGWWGINAYAAGLGLVNVTQFARMDEAVVAVALNDTKYARNADTFTVTVTDMGNNTRRANIDQVKVNITSTASPGGIVVLVNESAADTGVFTTFVDFDGNLSGVVINNTGSSCDISASEPACSVGGAGKNYTLLVAEGDFIYLKYVDAVNLTGNAPGDIPQTRDNATVYQVMRIALNTSVLMPGINTFSFTVVDADNNTDPGVINQVVVTLNSTYNRGGLNLTLNESGVNTGIFNVLVNESTYQQFNLTLNVSDAAGGSVNNKSDTSYYFKVAQNISVMVWAFDQTGDDAGRNAGSSNQSFLANVEQNGNVSFNDTKYVWNADVVTVDVYDMGNNTNASHVEQIKVNITSTASPGGMIVLLNESGVNTGRFNLPVNFNGTLAGIVLNSSGTTCDVSTSAGAGAVCAQGSVGKNYTLLVAQGNKINVTYIDAVNFTGAASATVRDNATVFQVAQLFLNTSVFIEGTNLMKITVVDADNNTEPLVANQVVVTINSSVMPEGLNVTLNESGVDTGIFNIIVNASLPSFAWNFTFNSSANAKQVNSSGSTYTLPVIANSTIMVTVLDQADADSVRVGGYSNHTAIAHMEAQANVSLNYSHYTDNDTVYLFVMDMGNNSNASTIDQVWVNITSTRDLGGILVLVNESGVDSGLFNTPVNASGNAANVVLNYSGSSCSVGVAGGACAAGSKGLNYTLLVADSAEVTAKYINITYLDERNLTGSTGGNARTQTDNATIYMNAWIEVNATVIALGNGTLNITIHDFDANVNHGIPDKVQVNVTSDLMIHGLNLTLNETGANTGVFSIIVNESSSVPYFLLINNTVGPTIAEDHAFGHLYAHGGSWINITYNDTTARFATTMRTIRVDSNSTAQFNESGYASSFTLKNVTIAVADWGRDVNTSKIDTLSALVKINSTSDPAGFWISLNESGVSTGMFNVTINTTTKAEQNITFGTSTNAGAYTLQVAAGDYVWVTYNDTSSETGAAYGEQQDRQAIFVTGSIRFNLTAYNTSNSARYEGVVIYVVDADYNKDHTKKDTVTINLTTSSAPQGINVTLNESDVDTGIFNISVNDSAPHALQTIKLMNAPVESTADLDGNDSILYKLGDTLVARYEDGNATGSAGTPTGTRVNATAEAVVNVEIAKRAGWDYFSVPFTADTGRGTVSVVFGGKNVNITQAGAYVIYYYDAGSTAWTAVSNSTTLAPLRGYIVKMTALDTMMVTPKKNPIAPSVTSPINPITLSLSSGWNLIGINNASNQVVVSALADLNHSSTRVHKWTSLYEYDTNQYLPTVMSDTSTMKMGSAYWAVLSEAATYYGFDVR